MARKGKSPGTCEYPDCGKPAVRPNFTIKTPFFTARVHIIRMGRYLCQEHLLLAMSQKRLPELGRAPGEGIEFPRKAFCEHRKESVSFEECTKCFEAKEHEKGFNHIGCQDALLQPSPLASLDKELAEAG